MFLASEIVASSVTGSLQRLRAINQKYCLRKIVFLVDLSEKRLSNNCICGWFKACMQQFICGWIDRRVQPILLIIELDHRLINRNVIRILPRFGL